MDLITLLQAAFLGLIEGLTEFIPVSSTGHLILLVDLLGFQGPEGKVFEIVIQLGAVLAVVVLYAQTLFGVLFRAPTDPAARRFILNVLLAFLPAAVLGAALHGFIKSVLFSPWIVCISLILGGLAILAIERMKPVPRHDAIAKFSPGLALRIGACQLLALVPGVSRSGATIMGALLLGVERKTAAEFSFFLAIPTMLGATVYDVYKNRGNLTPEGGELILVGFLVAFVAALLVVRGLIRFLSHHGFAPFAYYRIALGAVMLVVLFARPQIGQDRANAATRHFREDATVNLTRRYLLGSSLAAAAPLSGARAQATTIKIGVLNDQSGPYRDNTGAGSASCARQAVEEFGADHAKAGSFKVELISADHQNKPDIGVSIVRQWLDRDGVDMVLDVPTSSVALAVAAAVKERNKVLVNSGGGTADLTGAQCTPNTVHWTYDTYMLARSTASQLVRLGGAKWFFITADYVFGQQLERDAAAFVKSSGGTVMGRAAYPFPETTDFSSYLLQAQASGANVIGFASAGNDVVNSVKQAHEFGLARTMKMAALLSHPTDVDAIGPELAQGLFLTSTFYWDMNEGTRAFTKRVLARMPQRHPPNMIQAGCYAGTLHYLRTVAAMGAAKAKQDGAATVAAMKAMPTMDEAFGPGSIRADGRALFPAYLFEAKPPGEIHSQWDLLRLVATTPADQAWRPLNEGGCSLVRA